MAQKIHRVGLFAIILILGILVGCAGGGEALPSVGENQAGQDGAAVENKKDGSVLSESDSSTSETQEAVVIDPVRVLVADEIQSLEPYRLIRTHPGGTISSHLWDTLTRLNDDLQVEPHLAESWRLVNNFTWEVKLRQDVTFHDGEKLDAEAVRFSIERSRSMPNSLETFAQDVALEQVEVMDEYTLQITTRRPVPNLPYHLAFLEVLPPVYYQETDGRKVAVAPVGSGPYRLAEPWIPGKPLTLQANLEYWQGRPQYSQLVFETVPNVQERLIALNRGQASLVTDLPPMSQAEWEIQDSQLAAIESTQRLFIGMHLEEDSPLSDKRVRQALNYGLDTEKLVKDLLKGYGQRYGSWVNPPSNNPELEPWPYDPDLARELLVQAGYRDGFTTTLRTPQGIYTQDVAIAEAVAEQLVEIGVTVNVESAGWTAYRRELLTEKSAPLFLLGLNSWGNGLEDTQNLSSEFPFNPTNWYDAAFEGAVEQAASSFSDEARARFLDQAQAIAYEEAPWLWLWRPYHFYGVSHNLNWNARRDGMVNLYKPVESSVERKN